MMEGFLRWHSDKESVCQCRRCRRHRFDPWVGKIPWRRRWQLTAEFLPGNSHGQGHLAGYSPWDHRVRREPARRVAAAAHDRRILQTMWKCFPDVNCSQSFFLGNLIFFYVSGSPIYVCFIIFMHVILYIFILASSLQVLLAF